MRNDAETNSLRNMFLKRCRSHLQGHGATTPHERAVPTNETEKLLADVFDILRRDLATFAALLEEFIETKTLTGDDWFCIVVSCSKRQLWETFYFSLSREPATNELTLAITFVQPRSSDGVPEAGTLTVNKTDGNLVFMAWTYFHIIAQGVSALLARDRAFGKDA